MTSSPTTRSPTFYRVTIAVALLGCGYVVASGRLAAYIRVFRDALSRSAPPEGDAFGDLMTTSLVWIGSLAPLFYASWELGRQHVVGRRLGYASLVGLVYVFRIAFQGRLAAADTQAFAGAPRDDVSRAALWALLLGGLAPVFFLAGLPSLRTPNGVLWLCVTGALIGAAEFFRRRAAAYLLDEPRDVLRTYRLLNPARYEPRGRVFVKLQIAAMTALAFWWLGGGAVLVLGR